MYCTNCGKELDNQAAYCPYCGVATINTPKQVAPQPNAPKKLNAFGIVGFVLGVLSIILGRFFCVTPIIGLVFSIIAVVKMKKYNSANGIAIAGLVLNIISLVLWTFILVVLPFIGKGLAGLYGLLCLLILGISMP